MTEHLLPGYAGRIFIVISFIAAVIAAIFYLKATYQSKELQTKWIKKADYVFFLQFVSIFISGIILLFLLINRYYEYKYVWIHTENSLSIEYLVSAFWAGQEGSFLFWAICQAVFGLLIIKYGRDWKPYLMTIISLSQAFMVSMLLGINLGTLNIGMSPFLLLKEATENIGNPFFSNPDYIKQITDGNGLNPLLRNFWMLSHPPVLFIGFAALLIPFAYSIAGLWRKKYTEWIKPAMPWTIISIFFLGAGIMLGGVWAYESLTFGGFWAWDPIENASLVPWLILIAALHFMLITNKKKTSLFPTFIFTSLSFIFVLYSTFLTRSGVLAETSVHSFGNDGMGNQILFYILTFFIIAAYFIIKHNKKLQSKKSSELFSREFWLFIGSLVLILAAFQIVFTTSIPVFNKLFGLNLAPPVNVIEHYNKWQTPFAIAIVLLIGISGFLKWENNSLKSFLKDIWFSVLMAMIVWIISLLFYPVKTVLYNLMLLLALFAFFSSLDHLLRHKRKYIKNAAAITHLGFALFIISVVLSFSNKEVISKNTSNYSLGNNFSEQENLLLIKDEVLPMGDYHVVYKSNDTSGDRITYRLDFLKKNKDDQFYKVFSSYPSILLNEKMGNVYEPYAKIFPLKDIFTYITFAEPHLDKNGRFAEPDAEYKIKVNDTITINNNYLTLTDITTNISDNSSDFENVIVTSHLELITHFGESFKISPKYQIKADEEIFHDASIEELNTTYRLKSISEEPFTVNIEIYTGSEEFVIIKTIIFPFINLLWLSLIIMLSGILLSFRNRWKNLRKSQ